MLIFHEKYLAMGAFTREQPVMAFGMLAIVLQGVVFAYFFPLFYRHRGGGSPVVMNPDIRARYKELQEAIISRGGV